MYFATRDGTSYGFFLDKLEDFINFVEITENDYKAIIDKANKENKIIIPNENGEPVLDNPQELSKEELNRLELKDLKKYLAKTDYIIIKIAEGEATKQEYKDELQKRKDARKRINELEK